MCFSAVQLVIARENVFVCFERRLISQFLPLKHVFERVQIKQQYAPIKYPGWRDAASRSTLSAEHREALAPMKDPLSVSDLLHLRGRTPPRRHVALTAD